MLFCIWLWNHPYISQLRYLSSNQNNNRKIFSTTTASMARVPGSTET